jgi:hypothetical protein
MIDVFSYKGPQRAAPAYWVMYNPRYRTEASSCTWVVPGTHEDDPSYAAARAEGSRCDS